MQIIVKRAVLSQQMNPLKKNIDQAKWWNRGDLWDLSILAFHYEALSSIAILLQKRLCYFALLSVLGQVGFKGCLFSDAPPLLD